MNESKNVKALKKQLAAAIAMVLVAAIALGSSTYAWFVSNNSVKATTTSIAAQSNSAYLLIANQTAGATTHESASIAVNKSEDDTIALYPAQWKNGFDASKKKVGTEGAGAAVYQFESAYASATGAPNEKDNTRFAVGDPAAAVTAKYAYLNTFYVGTGKYDGVFENLKVTGMKVTATNSNQLTGAIRLLVKCGDAWVVAKVGDSGFEIESESGSGGIINAGKFGKSTTGEGAVHDVQVDVYVYYDGADSAVFSDNLSNINTAGVSATVTFEATPTEFGK